MTETSPITLGNPHRPRPPSRRGRRAVPQHRDPRRRPGRPHHRRAPGERGELLVRGPAGVRRATGASPDETAETLLAGRLAAHRRHRRGGRGRLRLRRRPDQGAHHHRRLQRLAVRGGGRAQAGPGRRPTPPSSGCRATTAARRSSRVVDDRRGRPRHRRGPRACRSASPPTRCRAGRRGRTTCPARRSARSCAARCATGCSPTEHHPYAVLPRPGVLASAVHRRGPGCRAVRLRWGAP